MRHLCNSVEGYFLYLANSYGMEGDYGIMNTIEIRQNIKEQLDDVQVVSSHEHHLVDGAHKGLNLDKVFRSSYVGWCGIPFSESTESKGKFLEKVRFNSYFVWLERALQDLYGFCEPISVDNWDEISSKISASHENTDHHIWILQEKCKYYKAIQDGYWDPGSDMGHSSVFAPTYRINMFLYGHHREAQDHNGNNPLRLFDVEFTNIDDYVEWMGEKLAEVKKAGAVALKSAIAYERTLSVDDPSRDEASQAMGKAPKQLTAQQRKAFEDYVFNRICEFAEKLALPFQNHTGLAKIGGSNPMNLEPTIARHRGTKFVLFHGGYPWIHEIGGLAHNYSNVYPDLCWLPIISTTAAVSALHEYIEVTPSITRLCWGGDAWISEESYGAIKAFRYVLEKVLAEKVWDGYMQIDDAIEVGKKLLYKNAMDLYGV